MKQKHTACKAILLWIFAGCVIGSLIGLIGAAGILPESMLRTLTGWTIRICTGIIVLLVDGLCIWALIRRRLMYNIAQNGASAVGTVTAVREIPHPADLNADVWTRRVRFVFTVSYPAGTAVYEKEFPPTCLLSRQALYPVQAEEGSKLPVRYHLKHPRMSLIDVDAIADGTQKEQQNAAKFFVLVPVLLTTVWLWALFL